MPPDDPSAYVPGRCNIGNAEVKLRRVMGWGGVVCCVLFMFYFIVSGTPAAWRLAIFVPAFLAAMGFLQARQGFCAKYGLFGEFNFESGVGRTSQVEAPEDRQKDRRTAVGIVGVSLLAGALVAAAAYFTAG